MTGRTLTLAHGALRFSARSQGEGPVVLLLHGFPDTVATFDAQLPALAAAGYQAVAVTLRGYEPCSQPADGDYHAVRMAEDVIAWLDAFGAPQAHLVGHDWGASIAYAAAARTPDRFASLTTLAVPHPARFAEAYASDTAQQARSAYILQFLAPGFEQTILAEDCSYLSALWQSWSPEWQAPASMLGAMRNSFAQPGVARAALEYYRQAFDVVSTAGAATQALFATPIAVPTLGICGARDGCINARIFAASMRAMDFPEGLRVDCLPDAGHFLHAEQPDAVNALLLDWIGKHSAPALA